MSASHINRRKPHIDTSYDPQHYEYSYRPSPQGMLTPQMSVVDVAFPLVPAPVLFPTDGSILENGILVDRSASAGFASRIRRRADLATEAVKPVVSVVKLRASDLLSPISVGRPSGLSACVSAKVIEPVISASSSVTVDEPEDAAPISTQYRGLKPTFSSARPLIWDPSPRKQKKV